GDAGTAFRAAGGPGGAGSLPCFLTPLLSVRRSGCPLGSHAWILIAMFHLAMDLASCQPVPGGAGGRLSPRPALRHRLSRSSLWGAGSGEELRRPGPPCAQSGRPRRNSHQRKLEQQEESCQNLTDFAPPRVPSALDIFTAYNETLQCSHECVRTPLPVYAEEALRSPGDYKTTFNGNRPSSSDRHLIPVAFVSEKWFEISC
ncbi:adherens junctions associated protein 1, partial [Columba livia]